MARSTGKVKWFSQEKGYGFIVPDNGWPDVLLHVTVLRRDGYQTAYEGARVVCAAMKLEFFMAGMVVVMPAGAVPRFPTAGNPA